MITFKVKGDFKKTNTFFEKCKQKVSISILDKYGKLGVRALRDNTPIDTGLLSKSWSYVIESTDNGAKIVWHNSDIEGGCNVALLVQYGHGTKGGTYVQGQDYINPAMQVVFEKLAHDLETEVW